MCSVCEFVLLLVELKKWQLRNEVALGLGHWWISWPTTAYLGICDHWKSQQARNFCGKSELLRQGQDALEKYAVARPGKRIRTKKVTSELKQGLNFTVNVDFWFCNDRGWFLFFIFVCCPIQKVIFYKKRFEWHCTDRQLRQSSRDWESYNVLKQSSLVRPVLAGTAVKGLTS